MMPSVGERSGKTIPVGKMLGGPRNETCFRWLTVVLNQSSVRLWEVKDGQRLTPGETWHGRFVLGRVELHGKNFISQRSIGDLLWQNDTIIIEMDGID